MPAQKSEEPSNTPKGFTTADELIFPIDDIPGRRQPTAEELRILEAYAWSFRRDPVIDKDGVKRT